MLLKTKTIAAAYLLALALCGYGCASEAHADPSGSALRGSAAGSASVVDLDDDVDEQSDEASDFDDDADEASDLDDDADEGVDESNDADDDVDEQSEEAAGDDDFELTFDALPAAVKATATSEVGTGTITGIDRDAERSGVVYEVDYTRDGERHEADIAEDGTLLRSHLD
jgi:hypothetical protein